MFALSGLQVPHLRVAPQNRNVYCAPSPTNAWAEEPGRVSMTLPLVHCVARLCNASPQQAFRHLCTVAGMSRWCLGMFETREVEPGPAIERAPTIEPGLLTGRSLFTGATLFARLVRDDRRLRVDYAVGTSAESLVAWIHAEVTPGAQLGYAVDQCLVVLSACRPQSMADANWARVMRTHETEIDLIASQIDSDATLERQ